MRPGAQALERTGGAVRLFRRHVCQATANPETEPRRRPKRGLPRTRHQDPFARTGRVAPFSHRYPSVRAALSPIPTESDDAGSLAALTDDRLALSRRGSRLGPSRSVSRHGCAVHLVRICAPATARRSPHPQSSTGRNEATGAVVITGKPRRTGPETRGAEARQLSIPAKLSHHGPLHIVNRPWAPHSSSRHDG